MASAAAIHGILSDAALAKGCKVSFGVTVRKLEDDGASVSVIFTDGNSAAYDLIVGADGIHSEMRARLFPGVEAALTGHVSGAPAARPQEVLCSHLCFGGRHGVVGFCPISQSLGYVYVVQRAEPGVHFDRLLMHKILREQLEGYGGIIPGIADRLEDPEMVNYRPIESLIAPPPWYQGRTVIMGDAAQVRASGFREQSSSISGKEAISRLPKPIEGTLAVTLLARPVTTSFDKCTEGIDECRIKDSGAASASFCCRLHMQEFGMGNELFFRNSVTNGGIIPLIPTFISSIRDPDRRK